MSARGRDQGRQPVEKLQGCQGERHLPRAALVWGVSRPPAHLSMPTPGVAHSARPAGPSLALAFESLPIEGLDADCGVEREAAPVSPLTHVGRGRREQAAPLERAHTARCPPGRALSLRETSHLHLGTLGTGRHRRRSDTEIAGQSTDGYFKQPFGGNKLPLACGCPSYALASE